MTEFDRRTALRSLIGGAATVAGMTVMSSLSTGRARGAGAAPESWMLEGITAENCTCNAFCVFNLGSKAKGWHRGACMWSLRNGHSNGVDLSGTSFAMAYEAPDESVRAAGTMRVYIGESASAAQQRELESILLGNRGGVFATFRDSLTHRLPVQRTRVTLVDGDTPSATIGDVGHVVWRRLKNSAGKPTVLRDAELPRAFGVVEEDLCDAMGSSWSDPDMTPWRCGGAGGIAPFTLRG